MKRYLRKSTWILSSALVVSCLNACGASTELGSSVSDIGERDAGRDLNVQDAQVEPPPIDTAVVVPPPVDMGVDTSGPFVDSSEALECLRDSDCGDGACIRNERITPTDLSEAVLQCGDISATATDGLECQVSEDCGRGLCLVADTCVVPCRADRDCTVQEQCVDVLVRGDSRSLQTLRGCTEIVSVGEQRDVRDFDMSTRAGFRLFVPGRVRGRTNLTIFEGFPVGAVVRFFDGNDDLVFSGFQRPAGQFINPIALVDGLLAVRVPMSERAPFTDLYQLEFAGDLRVRAREIRISGPTGGDTIDFDVFYFPAAVTVGANRVVPRAVAAAFANMTDVLEAAGIRVGTIRHHPVVGATARRLTVAPLVDRVHENIEEARAMSAGLNRASVPIFWMREIEGVLGTAGNIPGPWGVHGTIHSGIGLAVDVSFEMGSPGLVLAHEVGHFLGLFHSTEFNGTVFDPTEDTPVCVDTNGNGVAEQEECPVAAANLMFWAGIDDDISAEQAQLMQDSLLVR